MRRTNTEFHMTTSFHPQADGRSERTNRTVGQVLRTFTAKRQGKWMESLAAVEFAVNTAVNVLTGKSPFDLIFGRTPRLFAATMATAPPTLTKWMELRDSVWATARDTLWTSQIQQAIQHNRSCRPPASYPTDSWALLNAADWQGKHTGGVHKL